MAAPTAPTEPSVRSFQRRKATLAICPTGPNGSV